MSSGNPGNFGDFDLGFEVPEAKIVQEKIEAALPPLVHLQEKIEDTLRTTMDDAAQVINGHHMKMIGKMGEYLGDSDDRLRNIKSKITPVVNQRFSEAQVPALRIVRERDQVFDSLLGNRTEVISQVAEKIPQFPGLLLWTWQNEVSPKYPNLTRDDFTAAGDELWNAAIAKANDIGTRGFSSTLEEAETIAAHRVHRDVSDDVNCPDGGTWIEPDPITGGGYCEGEGDDVVTSGTIPTPTGSAEDPFTPVETPTIDSGSYCIGTADGFTFTDTPPKMSYNWIETGTKPYGGYFQNLDTVYICQGDVPLSILPVPPPGFEWVKRGDTGFAYVQQTRKKMRIINPTTKQIVHVTSVELLEPCPEVCKPEPTSQPEPIPTVETSPTIGTSDCPPVSTPCIQVNCVTGIEPLPVPLPLDCRPGDPGCDEEIAEGDFDPCENATNFYVFYSPTDQGCYYRCDNSSGIRASDKLLATYQDKESADRHIAEECSARDIPEIYYPQATPYPVTQSTQFPNLQESYFCSLDEWVNKFITPILTGIGSESQDVTVKDMLAVLGINESGRIPFLDNRVGDTHGIAGVIANTANNVVQSIVVGLVTGAFRLAEWMGTTRSCFSATWTGNALTYTLWGFLEQYISPVFGQLAQQPKYRVQAECPQLLPDLAQAITMFISGKIDNEEMQALSRLNNYCFEPVEKLIQANESQYTTSELLMLRMRGQIDENTYRYEIRRNGFMAKDAPEKLWDLHRAVPPISDLVRFMVRDVADNQIATKYGLDQDFAKKWTGNVKRWGEEQGVNEYIAGAYWRAHWQMPAPSQLFEMGHRLSRLPAGDPAFTDWATIEEAMRINDWPDFWIKRFKEISFRRLTRVDLRRAYLIGSINRAQVVEGYQQLGYDNANANVLADFAESLLVERLEKSRDVKLYKQGVIDAAELRTRLIADGANLAQANKIITDADSELDALVKEKCAEAIRDRFLQGTINQPQATAELILQGTNVQRTNQLLRLWNCELSARDKKPTTSRLCKFKEQGLINNAQFTTSLQNLGWDPIEIANIIASCDLDIGVKQHRAVDKAARQAQALARREAADQRRRQAEARAAAKEIEGQARKALTEGNKLQKAQEASQKANLKRKTILIKAADKVADIYGLSIEDAISAVTSASQAMRRDYGFNANQATEAVKVGVQGLPKADPPEFMPYMRSIAEGYVEA